MKLHEAEINRKVIYTPYEGCDPSLKEEGIITSINCNYVFVRYGNDVHSKGTRPEDIEYLK